MQLSCSPLLSLTLRGVVDRSLQHFATYHGPDLGALGSLGDGLAVHGAGFGESGDDFIAGTDTTVRLAPNVGYGPERLICDALFFPHSNRY